MGLAIRVGKWINIFASAIRFTRTIGAVKERLSGHGNPDRRHDPRAGYCPFYLLDLISQGYNLALNCKHLVSKFPYGIKQSAFSGGWAVRGDGLRS